MFINTRVVILRVSFSREENGDPVTLMFELDGCGLKNMDMEFIQYLIGVFRDYSPFSLNYILVYEMPWVLKGRHPTQNHKQGASFY